MERELLKRLKIQLDKCSLVIRRAGTDGLSVFGGEKEVEMMVVDILQETWESADVWFH